MIRTSYAFILFATALHLLAEVLVPLNSNWSYFKGTTAPAVTWNTTGFDVSTWPRGSAPFYYGENLTGGTLLGDMRNGYTTFYLRNSFTVVNASEIDRLVTRVQVDDGFIVWINGVEVARFNVSGEPAFNGVAQATIEPTWVTNSLPSPSTYLREGANVIAVHVLNRPITSSDIVLNLQLDSTSDRRAPEITSVTPAPGKLSELTSVTVRFSEPVQGVSAEDLLINNQPAETVSGSADIYTFRFLQPQFGAIDITWEAGHDIADFADPPHPLIATNWSYILADETAPFAVEVLPPDGLIARSLTQAEVRFNEPISGIRAEDLLVNGLAATNLQARANNTFVFQFPIPPAGPVQFTWSPAHAIVDLAVPPNRFAPISWSCTLDPSLPESDIIITEFLASAENVAGLKDENGELQDWIELHNRGSISASLTGWSLTDDPEESALWIFPNITLPPGGHLIIFASGKDRKPVKAGSRLHTNFKLGNDGEYLGLYNSDSPRRAVSEFRGGYPIQRDDYSYGLDASGVWRYFQAPSPGQPNGTSTIVGITPNPKVSARRGYVQAPFSLVLSNDLPGSVIRYTLDGSPPAANGGIIYSAPLLISKTTVLRAAAYRDNYLPSKIVSHTYIFPEQILRQTNNPPGFPVGPAVMSGYPSDYEMDPEVVNDPAYSNEMKAALEALPIISITIKMDDMFGAANGIYTHPLSRGPAWERPCSVEFIPPGGDDFQIDCGIQVQGNAAREPIKQPKHPFRITFKGDYGPKKLSYRVFPDSPVDSFDTLILRADFNVSWLHWNPVQRIRGQRTRDAWMKNTMRAMGGLASHNRFAHLYINGLYWGIYEPTERPDGSFGEAYFGGQKEDYDVINEGAVVDGNATAYNRLLSFSDLSTLSEYNAIQEYLDMPQFIDYMLLHFFVGHEDWFNNKNWYTIRPKDGSRGFMYVPWDGELVLGDTGLNRVSTTDLPSGLHPKLLASAQYRLDFADRVHRHFFNNGALTPAQNNLRWLKRAREIELPIIVESARWGDYRRDVHQYSSPPYEIYTRDVQWRAEQNRLLNTYFPTRTSTVLNQLRAAGLYPQVAAPVLNQFGGQIAPNFSLQISAQAGSIYYTTNGVDPRVYGSGQISPIAVVYTREIALSQSTHVKARVLSNGAWSALTEAVFFTDTLRTPLRITEIMYHPDPPGDAFEFIELQNLGTLPIDAAGFYLQGVDFVFPLASIIQPGEHIVLGSAENPITFAQRYPNLAVFGRFKGQLVNRGERLALVAPGGQTISSVDYKDENGWPTKPDGEGYSLEVIDPLGDPDDPANWQASHLTGGSPARSNSQQPPPGIFINEAMPQSVSGPDWIEIHNATENPADLGSWTLTQVGNSNRFSFPPGTTLNGQGYLLIYCDKLSQPGTLHAPFALDSEGETLILSDAAGEPVDLLSYGPLPVDHSFGHVAGQPVLGTPTPNAPNTAVALGVPEGLIINEWLGNPPAAQSDWLEIFNPDVVPVSLRGLFVAVSNQLFEVTAPVFVGPGGHLQLFADEQPGPDHLDLKLPAGGASITLYTSSGQVLDTVTYGSQVEAVSQGRFPDASPNVIPFPISPSPGARNNLSFPLDLTLDLDGIRIQWPALPGARYRVESSADLSSWSQLFELTATATQAEAKDSMSFSRKYYRVLALP